MPHTSVAVHVRVIVYWLAQLCPLIASETLTVTVPAQLSDALTLVLLAAGTLLAHAYVMFAGVPVMTGFVVSCTVMCCTCLTKFPHVSRAVHVRINPPAPEQPPCVAVSSNVTCTNPQLSLAVIVGAVGIELQFTIVSDGN